jgi:ADP-ribose pyrophosphatase YjhB (NUDIX family)
MSKDIYAGVCVYRPGQGNEEGKVLCVKAPNYPEFKMAGGMSIGAETPEETARREGLEELRTQFTSLTLVFVEETPGRGGGPPHKRYFYLAEGVKGALEIGASWQVEEKDPSGRILEKLTAQWVPIREFADKLFFKQRPAFGAILSSLASRSMTFCQEYQDLVERFPEPENLGLVEANVH